MSLTDDLAARNAAARERIPTQHLAVMDAATEALRETGLAASAVDTGAAAPDFVLPDATGNEVRLSDQLLRGPVVLSFYRGGWCPYCSLELRALQAALGDLAAADATLVAVSPQAPDASLDTAEKQELTFPVLSDVGNEVARRYGLVFTVPADLRATYDVFGIDLAAANGTDAFELPIPATYVIDRDGIVRFAFVDADYTKRADPNDVVAALDELAAAAR